MKKKAIVITFACILLCATVLSISFGNSNKELPIVTSDADYLIDIDNPSVVAGFVDFVFVGKVEKQNGVKYESVSTRETENGSKTSGRPYTSYDITVLENLKGNLKPNDTLVLWKAGGISMDGKYISIEEDDFLPSAGDVCVFYATAEEDGSLHILGKNGNIKLAESKLKNNTIGVQSAEQEPQSAQTALNSVAQSPLYQELVEACENEIPYQRERFTAPAALLEAPAE
jgi:hypothetical protein